MTRTTIVTDDGTFLWHVEASDGANTTGWTSDHSLDVYSIAKTGPNQVSLALPQPSSTAAPAGFRSESLPGFLTVCLSAPATRSISRLTWGLTP